MLTNISNMKNALHHWIVNTMLDQENIRMNNSDKVSLNDPTSTFICCDGYSVEKFDKLSIKLLQWPKITASNDAIISKSLLIQFA